MSVSGWTTQPRPISGMRSRISCHQSLHRHLAQIHQCGEIDLADAVDLPWERRRTRDRALTWS